MTKEPDYNAHVRCVWCHAVRPVKETISFNGQTLCRDTDCLKHMRRACDVSFVHLGDYPDGGRSADT